MDSTYPVINCTDGQIVRLIRSLYGLRQELRLRYIVLVGKLKSNGFQQLEMNEPLLILRRANGEVFIICYVDDIGLFGNKNLVDFIKRATSKYLEITELGRLSFFLGMVRTIEHSHLYRKLHTYSTLLNPQA